ncbi:HEPN domain-containing protein [Candidatus Desantisbacteria bacterium]|nr:HEPN domain-containing protein [Candidatus Desantisbacteria bacterium]
MDKRLNLVNHWFKKADNDLKNAKIVIEAEDAPVDTVCFHCQQSVEKYLCLIYVVKQILLLILSGIWLKT